MDTKNDGLDLSRLETQSQPAASLPREPETTPLTRSGPRQWRILRAFVLLVVIAGGVIAWLSAHHILQTDNGITVIGKRYFGFENTLVDIRNWDYLAFEANPELSKAMELQGYSDLVQAPPPDPTVTERVDARLRRHVRELRDNVETGLQHAGETTRDWAVYVVDYWKNKFNG